MTKPSVLNPKFDGMIWLLVKSWVLGLLVVAALLAFIFAGEIDMSLPTSTPLKVAVSLMMSFLFMLLSATIFTAPLMIVAGLIAIILHDQIRAHPWIATLCLPILMFALIEILTGLFTNRGDTGLVDTLVNSLFNAHTIAILIALTVAIANFSFKLGGSETPSDGEG